MEDFLKKNALDKFLIEFLIWFYERFPREIVGESLEKFQEDYQEEFKGKSGRNNEGNFGTTFEENHGEISLAIHEWFSKIVSGEISDKAIEECFSEWYPWKIFLWHPYRPVHQNVARGGVFPNHKSISE